MLNLKEVNGIEFYRLKNDINGNPRYAFDSTYFEYDYVKAKKIAKKLGMKVYRGKEFRHAFVVQSYNLERDSLLILAESLRPILKGEN